MSVTQQSAVTLLQPLDVPFLDHLRQTISFSAITVNPARTSFNDTTYADRSSDSNILVDMSSARNSNTLNMQLVPLSVYNRRAVSRASSLNGDEMEMMPIISPEPKTAPNLNDGSGAQWFTSLLMLLLVTPSLLNILCIIVWAAASYYYSVALQVGTLSVVPTFWDRTYWAVICGLPVYASYCILDGIAGLVEKRAIVQAFGARASDSENHTLLLDPASSFADFWTGVWRMFVSSLTPYVLFANIAWYIHLFVRFMMRYLSYATVAFYVTVMLWSQYGIPYSILPSANSPVVGAWIGVAERVFGPIAMPITSAWTQSTYVMPTTSTPPQSQYVDGGVRLEDYFGYQ